jgi:hypothetical protein
MNPKFEILFIPQVQTSFNNISSFNSEFSFAFKSKSRKASFSSEKISNE